MEIAKHLSAVRLDDIFNESHRLVVDAYQPVADESVEGNPTLLGDLFEL